MRIFNRLLAIALLFALSYCGSSASQAADANIEVCRNLVYVERDSGPLEADVYMPAGAGPFPGVVVVHGGAWTIGSRIQLAAVATTLAKHGYSAMAITYRLAPRHPFPAQLCDCQAAVRWLRQNSSTYKVDPSRIGGYGYSAGGQLVALLGTLDDDDFREEGVPKTAPSARLQAVIAGGAPCDFRNLPVHSSRLAYWLGGTRASNPDLYHLASPAAFITSDDPPIFFFHGALDALVPITSPRRMAASLTRTGVTAELYEVAEQGHIAALFDREALRRALAFADKHLKKAPAVAAADTPAASSIPSKGGPADGN